MSKRFMSMKDLEEMDKKNPFDGWGGVINKWKEVGHKPGDCIRLTEDIESCQFSGEMVSSKFTIGKGTLGKAVEMGVHMGGLQHYYVEFPVSGSIIFTLQLAESGFEFVG